MSRIYSLILLLVVSAACYGNSPERSASLSEADSAYKKGDYEKAVGLYQQAIDSEGTSSGGIVNLGHG